MIYSYSMKWISILFILTYYSSALAQDDYFQQEVDYKIEVELDTATHTLIGKVAITYTNNSTDDLDKIYFHLWPNAYSSKFTPLAKQMIDAGSVDFHFAREHEMGGISELDFKVDGEQAAFQINKEQVDIGILLLNKDLKPGSRIVITTPFTVRIPKSYSRMGRGENDYQLTQWYPKPAVYDRDGWHPMSYLNMGEFYSEFGQYDVHITTPSDYIVASTGTLVSESLDGPKKIQHYSADSVHDFAWFVDRDFKVDRSVLTLPSGKEVEVTTYYTAYQEDLWSLSLDYAQRALTFFSEEVGEYPYPQYTVVQSPLQAGGGMEYPMITVIDEVMDAQELDHVIAHEIGHSWFYGILASNERMHPWMDEGMTTYFDHKYIYKYYQDDHFSNMLPGFIASKMDYSMMQFGHQFFNHQYLDEAVNVHSEKASMENYVLSAYVKAPLALKYLESYLGSAEMNKLFKGYYEMWKFKHPNPQDVQSYFTRNASKDIKWFFDHMINSNDKVDYKIKNAKQTDNGYTLSLHNATDVSIPILISAIKDKKVIDSVWVDSFVGDSEYNYTTTEPVDGFAIDADAASGDINRKNNYIKTGGLLKKTESPHLAFLMGPDNKEGSRVFFSPYLGYNAYDGLQVGLNLTKAFLPDTRIMKTAFVGYGTGSNEPVGLINMKINKYFDNKAPRQLTGGFHLRRFSSNSFEDIDIQYIKFMPSLHFDFKKSKRSKNTHSIFYIANYLDDEYLTRDMDELVVDRLQSLNHTIGYSFTKKHALTPLSAMISLEQESYKNILDENHQFLKWIGEFKLGLQYAKHKHIKFRLFASSFLDNSQSSIGSVDPSIVRGSIPLIYQGFNDYRYDNYHFGRSEQTGLASQQIHHGQGGFKNALSSSFGSIGTSNDYVVAFNIKADFPKFRLPIKLYFDYGIYNAKPTSNGPFERKSLYSAGAALEWLNGAIGIYFPVVNSSEINTAYNTIADNYLERISFSLELTKLNVWDWVQSIGR